MTDTVPAARWMRLELYGHIQIAGRVSEIEWGGATMLRIEIPTTKRQEGFEQWIGGKAIFRATPITEAQARDLAVQIDARPLPAHFQLLTGSMWDAPIGELEAGEEPIEDAEIVDDEQDDNAVHTDDPGF